METKKRYVFFYVPTRMEYIPNTQSFPLNLHSKYKDETFERTIILINEYNLDRYSSFGVCLINRTYAERNTNKKYILKFLNYSI